MWANGNSTSANRRLGHRLVSPMDITTTAIRWLFNREPSQPIDNGQPPRNDLKDNAQAIGSKC